MYKIIKIIILLICISNASAQEILIDPLEQETETLLFTSVVIPSHDSLVPSKAMESLISFRENNTIRIEENNRIEWGGQEDIGQARRVDYIGARSPECLISFNSDSSVFKDTTNNNVFTKMHFNERMVKEFIFLHELTHCQDEEIEPQGVDPIQWREALADGYAMATMLDSHLINLHNMNIFKVFRNNNESHGSVLMLNFLPHFFEDEIKEKNMPPIERLNKVKQLRNIIYNVR